MKRLTVAAAAFAAGMLTIVVPSLAESEHNMLGSIAKATAKTEKSVKKAEAASTDADAKKSKTALLEAKNGKPARTKIGRKRPGVDAQTTASIASAVRPELKAVARRAVKGLADVELDTKVASAANYTTIVARYAASYGVPASLAHAVIRIESNYRPNMRGGAGEVGLMQIKPATARMMGYSGSVTGLFDPDTNIKFGMKYLAMAHQLSGGETCGTILRYNAGHGAHRMNPVSAAYCSKVKHLLAG